MNASNPALHGLLRRLVASHHLDESSAQQALKICRNNNPTLVSYLVEQSGVSAAAVATATAYEYGLPLLDLDAIDVGACPRQILNRKLVNKYLTLPIFQRGNRLYVAVSDPTNHQALNEIRFYSGATPDTLIVEHDKLKLAIERFLRTDDEDITTALGNLADINLELIADDPVVAAEDDTAAADDAPVVRFINKLLLDAIKQGASDIHFEPYEKFYRIRFRTDGILEEITQPPIALAPRLAARLKIMAQLDISERRLPQDGRIKLRMSKTRAIDFRVNTLPTHWGEKVVLRILDAGTTRVGIEALGFDEEQRTAYLKALNLPQGMILVTGPTGSGKTVTLYTGLGILNTKERNISTAEDPIEINMDGVNQVQVNPRVGMTFAECLRAFLRQDPDIIMVGEIRDLETAEIAIKAAQTGHLVLSTLHTNSAPATITRLLNIGVASFNLATSVSLIIAQRLARRLCVHCRVPAELPARVLTEEGFDDLELPLEELHIYRPTGCQYCKLGYKGRTGLYEVMRMTPTIARLIMEGRNAMDIATQARAEGFRPLRQIALRKVADGTTSLEEANRITKD